MSGERDREGLPYVADGSAMLRQRVAYVLAQTIDVNVKLVLRTSVDRVDCER